MHDDQTPIDEPFPWLGLLGCAVIIAVVIGVALTSGMCAASTPC